MGTCWIYPCRAVSSDKRYGEIKEIMVQESRKGEVRMCTLFDNMIQEGRFESLEKLVSKGLMSLEEAMEALDFSEEEKSSYKKWIADNKQS